MKIGTLAGQEINNYNSQSDNVRYKEGNGYLNDARLESFGNLLADYIMSGAELTQDPLDKRAFSISEGLISFQDQLWRSFDSRFRVSKAGVDYYVGFLIGQGYVTGLSEPTKDYLPLWVVTTNGDGEILSLSDKRGALGKIKYKAIYDGVYLNTGEVQEALVASIAATVEATSATVLANESAGVASTSADLSNTARIELTADVTQSLVEMAQERTETAAVKASTESVRVATDAVRSATEQVRVDALAAKDATITATTEANAVVQQNVQVVSDAQAMADNLNYIEDYNLTTQYKKNNFISFNGSTYMAITDSKGIAPPALPITSNENWVLSGRKGADGTGTVVVNQDTFIAEAGQTVFALTKTYDQFQNRISVVIGGVPQDSGVNFNETAPTYITTTSGVPLGVKVVVNYFSEAQPLATDLGLTVANHTVSLTELGEQLSDLLDDVNGGFFGETSTGLNIDGGGFA